MDQKLSRSALGAVVFNAESFDASGEVRRDVSVTYKIRLRAEQYDGTYHSQTSFAGDWLTSRMFPIMASVGPRGDKFGGRQPGWNPVSKPPGRVWEIGWGFVPLLISTRMSTIPTRAFRGRIPAYQDQIVGKCHILNISWTWQYSGPLRASLGPGGTTLTGPRPLPLQAASPPNQTSFVVGLSENTQVYTAGVSLGYRISATVIRLCLP